MIVRCSGCKSAFAVDDGKVENKKFAFSCPKCSTENIINNTVQEPEIQKKFPYHKMETTSISTDIDSETVNYQQDFNKDEQLLEKEITTGAIELEEEKTDSEIDISLSDGIQKTETGDNPDIESRIIQDEPVMKKNSIHEAAESNEIKLENDVMDDDADLENDFSFDEGSDIESSMLDDISTENTDFELIEEETPGQAENDRERTKDITIEEDSNDIITVDLDALEIDYEDDDETIEEAAGEKLEPETTFNNNIEMTPSEEEEITSTLDTLDFEMNEDITAMDTSPEDISIDEEGGMPLNADSLDIDFIDEDMLLDSDSTVDELIIPEPGEEISIDENDDISLNIDSLNIGLTEEGQGIKSETSEIELDILEISAEAPDDISIDDEEDISLNIDSLDIDLDEDGSVMKGETPEGDFETPIVLDEISESGFEDNDISLDINTLDIDIKESDTILEGDTPGEDIKLNDDEKLTLDDAGLTFDELTTEELSSVTDEFEDESLKLTVDEIDPELDLYKLDQEPGKKDINDNLKEIDLVEADSIIPDIDFDELDQDDEKKQSMSGTAAAVTAASIAASQKAKISDNEIDLDIDNDYQAGELGKKGSIPHILQKGTVNFSFDYSLSYSKAGAILRLLCVYLFAMIPHLAVFAIYSTLSLILSTLNNIVVLSTGKPVDDFLQVQENTLRYYLSISSSLIGIIEDMPVFTGKDDIDYSLQMNIIYSLRYSKLFAALRLSVIGVTIICLPHLIVISALSLAMPFIFLAGLISVIITGTWPQSLFNFLTRYYRFTAKVMAFTIGLVDTYPPFKFE